MFTSDIFLDLAIFNSATSTKSMRKRCERLEFIEFIVIRVVKRTWLTYLAVFVLYLEILWMQGLIRITYKALVIITPSSESNELIITQFRL